MKKSQPSRLRVMRETIRELTQNASAVVGGLHGCAGCTATGCISGTIGNHTGADNQHMSDCK